MVANILRTKGYDEFVPLVPLRTSRARNARATKEGMRPLYQGYIFCRFDPAVRARIVTTSGILRIVGCGQRPLSLSQTEIDNIQTLVSLV